MRDERVRPRVSSRTAARVRSASANPKLTSALAAASGDKRPAPASASSSGRK